MPLAEDPYRSFSRHYSILLCFIVVISRTKTAIEYPSINLVLYSYTPNEELDSWQIVLAHDVDAARQQNRCFNCGKVGHER